MSKDLNAAVKIATEEKMVYDVVRGTEKIMIPDNCTIDQAVEMLLARKKHDAQRIRVSRTMECMPQEGALALHKVLTEKYGFAAEGWGTNMEVEAGYRKKVKFFWGEFPLKEMDGSIQCAWSFGGKSIVFQLIANAPRMYEGKLKAIFDEVEKVAREESIYRGHALKIDFETGGPMPQIEFMNPVGVLPEHAIYARGVQEQLEINLYTPIQRAVDCLANGISLKRGVLLSGVYGTGKTLAAGVAQRLAFENGITYIYITDPAQLAKAVIFARQYQSPAAVIFCEDIDRVVTGERDAEIDSILNTVDGIDGKTSNIMIVLTTNEVEEITPAMLRPGRLDAVIEVTPPDAEAVERLIRHYAKDSMAPGEDVSEAGLLLAGKVPAVVAEVVKRAKLAQVAREAPGVRSVRITGPALAVAARSILGQIDLLDRVEAAREPAELPTLDQVVRDAVAFGVQRRVQEAGTGRYDER
jgi:transitional endoplasmic reticulum ATPase